MTATYAIHASDVRSFKSCRRRWDWSSGLRRNLEPDVTPVFFLVGRAIHQGMALYYENDVAPVLTYDEFMVRSHLDDEGLFAGEKDKRLQEIRIGQAIAENYLRWVRSKEEPDEKWRVVATEMPFKLPLPHPETGRPSRRIFLEGRFDQIIEDVETGLMYLREFKTAARDPNPNWLELDDQLTTYCYAAQQILGKPIAGIQYRFLMKREPEKPPRLKSGDKLSRAINSNLSTTFELYEEAIEDLTNDLFVQRYPNLKYDGALTDHPDLLLKWKEIRQALRIEYADIRQELLDRGWGSYFKEFVVRKTQHEIRNAARHLWEVGLEMTKPSVKIYPSPEWMKCQFCPFRTPCLVKNAGGDEEAILQGLYRERIPEPDINPEYFISLSED